MCLLNDELKRQGKRMRLVVVVADQVLSPRFQLSSRARGMIDDEDKMEELIESIMNAIDAGISLGQFERAILRFKELDEYYPLGSAANFYINKLGFNLVAAPGVLHKEHLNAVEERLLERLKSGKRLTDLQVFKLFSGRQLVKPIRDFTLGSNAAMRSSKNGGIDLTSANNVQQFQNSNGEIKFHLDPVMLKNFQNAQGFEPVIINIAPVGNLREFLGVSA